MSGENTPTLCYSIPAFQSFTDLWTKHIEEQPEWEDIIRPGVDKLKEYTDKLHDVHVLAMGEFYFILFFNI